MANEHINKVMLGDEVLLDLTADTAVPADVAAGKTLHLATGAPAVGTASYAGSPTVGGNANASNAILYGAVDSTSTATAFTATVEGLEALVDGTTIMLRNAVVTSAAGFTINVNSLGAKPVYNSLATGNPITPTAPTRDSTIFNINYTLMFVYVESDVVEGGCWLAFRGYDSNTNTLAYQVRTNNGNMVASDTGYRYRLWLTQADGKKWVPINTSTSTAATGNRTLNTRHIDPFGRIVYRATNGTCNAGSGLGATGIWDVYTLNVGYSYMASGFSLTAQQPVFLRCTPNSDGSATMEVLTQTLPSSKDGKIYIHLGTAYSTTSMELEAPHPVYYYDGTGIRIWTGAEPSSGPSPSSTTPAMDGTAAVGTSANYARADHVHPKDSSKMDVSPGGFAMAHGATVDNMTSGELYLSPGEGDAGLAMSTDGTLSWSDADGNEAAVSLEGHTHSDLQPKLVSGTNIKTINNTSLLGSGNIAISVPSASTTAPLMDGTASYGSGTSYARSNHVHPTDTSRAAATHTHTPSEIVGAEDYEAIAIAPDALLWASEPDNQPPAAGLTVTDNGNASSASWANVSLGISSEDYTKYAGVTAKYDGTDAVLEFAADEYSVGDPAAFRTAIGVQTLLPSVTASDNGKVLRVVGGAWAAASLPSASGVSF